MFKKLLASLLVTCNLLLIAFFLFVPAARAQAPGTWYGQDFRQWYTKVYDEGVSPPNEIFGERYTAAQVEWVIYGFWAFLINNLTNRNIVLCFMNQQFDECIDTITQLISISPQGAGLAEKKEGVPAWKMIFADREMSGITYVKEKLRSFHIVPEADAQEGYGFGALGPVRNIWTGVRNVSYALFVLVLLAFAFMIMFRVKISPQVVITVQSALPKLVIAIVVATFSYAIAGFLVDLVYVLIGLFALMLQQAGVISNWSTAYGFMAGNLFGGGIFFYFIAYLIIFFMGLVASLFVLLPLSIILPPLWPFPFVISGIATIVVAIVLIFAFFKIFWMLFKAVAYVYLLTIFAPLQIALGTLLPGGGFGTWLRALAANLAVFPIAGGLLYIALYFAAYSIPLAFNAIIDLVPIITPFLAFIDNLFGTNFEVLNLPGTTWSPPLIGMGGRGIALTFVFTSLIILLLIPKVAEIIRSLIQGRPFAYGTAIGEAISSPIVGIFRGGGIASEYGPRLIRRFGKGTTGPPETASIPKKISGGI